MKVLVDMKFVARLGDISCRDRIRGNSLVKGRFSRHSAVTHGAKPSVVQVRDDLLSPRQIGNAVVRAIHQARQELLDGALISVDLGNARLRILPLKK